MNAGIVNSSQQGRELRLAIRHSIADGPAVASVAKHICAPIVARMPNEGEKSGRDLWRTAGGILQVMRTLPWLPHS